MVRLPPALRPLFPYLKPTYVAATRFVAPASMWLSRRGSGLLPTGHVADLGAAAASTGGVSRPARPAETIERGTILGIPPGLELADRSDGDHVAPVDAAELPGARVLGPHRAVITARGDLVDRVSRYFGTSRPREHPIFLNPRPEPPLEVAGRLGVLASRGDSNYYHFLFDVLPRIGILEKSGLVAPDRWYVPLSMPFQRQALELLGIAEDSLIDADAHPHVRAELLVVPDLPAMSEKNPPWVVTFLRERLLARLPAAPEAGRTDRRIYITRGPAANNRSVINEAEVLKVLRRHGFDPIDPGSLSVVEQIQVFASASTIVAPHGAALANLAFASPGATVIELFPAGCLLPDFWRLACGVPGLRYRYLSADGGPRRPSRGSTIVRDIEVDLHSLGLLLSDQT